MDSPSACQDLKEPGVIDELMIYNAIIDQGPKDEEGRLYKEQGVEYSKVKHLRLEFLDILKIDHLWMMTGLTKLQLCNNIIEQIENLDMLTELRELDLSFNYIDKIKNLDALKKLEVLTLYENKIEVLENLDHLTNLTVLSVGNNKIADFENVIYLRGFSSLKSLNMAGNPICEDDNFVNHVIAYLPQLVYYEYRMIREKQKIEARQLFLYDLKKLERDEEDEKIIQIAKKKAAEQEKINEKAFVDGLSGDELFLMMFENDNEGKTLLHMGDTIKEIYKEYKRGFSAVTKEILALGLEQAEIRKAEMDEFNTTITKATELAYSESRKIMEDFLGEKQGIFSRIKTLLDTDEEDEETIAELSSELQAMNDTFHDLCLRTWNSLMRRELHFYEACEEVNGTYDRNLSEMVNHFVEVAQGLFSQLRQLQGVYHENVTDAANKFFTLYTVATAGGTTTAKEYASLPMELINILQDREGVINSLAASHDTHMLVIDQREDKLISGVRGWLANLVDNLVRSEIQRNRNTVTEINHFLDTQRAELEELTSTPLGLLLLPKEVQDALQIA